MAAMRARMFAIVLSKASVADAVEGSLVSCPGDWSELGALCGGGLGMPLGIVFS